MTARSWGDRLTLIAGADFKFLPGFFALFNSALMNGFSGRVRLLVPETTDTSSIPPHPQLEVTAHRADPKLFGPARKLHVLPTLPAGQYLLLDADFIIERPCGYLLEPIDAGLLVSTEPESKYDDHDVFTFHQCTLLGLPADLPSHPYVNAGFLGFEIPRDLPLLQDYSTHTARHLQGISGVCEPACFRFPEQDILNALVRYYRAGGGRVFSVSPKTLELGAYDDSLRHRPFPHDRQTNLAPPDRIKYFIHGAALRRPWLPRTEVPTLAGRVASLLEDNGVAATYRSLSGRLTSYERAWAYYACGDDRPIPVAAWADRHGFAGHKHLLWRAAHGLRPDMN